LAKEVRRSLDEKRKLKEELTRRPLPPETEKEFGAGEKLAEGRPAEAPAAEQPAEPAKPRDALARAKKPAADEAIPDAKAPAEERELADAQEPAKRIKQLILETPDVAETAGALKGILSAYEKTKKEQAEEGKGPAGKALELEKANADSAVYLVEVSTEEYQKLVKKLKALEGKAPPERAVKEKAKSAWGRKEEERAAPRRGAGAGKASPEAGPELKRRSVPKTPPVPGFSEEEGEPDDAGKPEGAKEDEEKESGGRKTTRKAKEDAKKELPGDKAVPGPKPAETITVVIRIVKRDIAHARLLEREAKQDAAESAPEKGK
jgi:hypothetical protein